MMNELIVVLINLLHIRHLQQVVAMIHQLTERVERTHNLLHVRDNRLILILRETGHIVRSNLVVDTEFHLLRVHEHKLQLVRMLLI